jgi:hypothetical protein
MGMMRVHCLGPSAAMHQLLSPDPGLLFVLPPLAAARDPPRR